MTGPPAGRPNNQEAGGASTRGKKLNPNYVQIINAPWNRHARTGVVKRKAAEFYVRSGMAEWLSSSTVRMIECPELATIRKRAEGGYNDQVDGTYWDWGGGVSDGATVLVGSRMQPRVNTLSAPVQTDSALHQRRYGG